MTTNPALTWYNAQTLGPHLYAHEIIALRRDFIEVTFNNLRTTSGRWSSKGCLFLTNLRLTFVAAQRDEVSGLHAFDIPLAFIRKERFNQPVFGCNNLSGEVWSTMDSGGPDGSLPPHAFVLYFKNGGVGTFLPLFFGLVEDARRTRQQSRRHSTEPRQQPGLLTSIKTAFVDPSDPSNVYLAQPVDTEDRLPPEETYAANFGAEESYEPILQ